MATTPRSGSDRCVQPGIGPRVADLVGITLACPPGDPMPASPSRTPRPARRVSPARPASPARRASPGRRASLALVPVAALVLAGCAAGAADPAADTADDTAADAAASGYPLTIDNCGTEVTLEAAPERIV